MTTSPARTHTRSGAIAMTNPHPARPQGRLLRAALAAAADGMYVFPLQPRGKTPALRDVDWHAIATRDRDQITDWWAARPYNIGLDCGRSDLLVIDLDDGRGETPPPQWPGARGGHDILVRLATEAGEPPPGEDTYCVTTPSSGRHLYYRQPAGVALPNSQSRIGWKIDSRGHGGYIVGAASVRDEGLYRVSRPGPIAELPRWLATALTPPPPPAPAPPKDLPSGRVGAYVAAIVDAEADTVARAPHGQRQFTLLRAAGTLGRLVAGGELSEHDARAALWDAAAVHIGVHGFTTAEAESTINRGLLYGQRLPRRIGRNRT